MSQYISSFRLMNPSYKFILLFLCYLFYFNQLISANNLQLNIKKHYNNFEPLIINYAYKCIHLLRRF